MPRAAVRTLRGHLDAAGYDARDADTLTMGMRAAVHEAGHHVARMTLWGIGGDVEAHPDGSGESHPLPGPPVEVDHHEAAAISMAGPVAEAEPVEVLCDDGCLMRQLVGLEAGARDLDTLPVAAFPPYAESAATTLVWQHWAAVLRLAGALLDAPTGRLSWDEAVAVAGAEVLLAAVDEELAAEAWAVLLGADIDRITDGWPA